MRYPTNPSSSRHHVPSPPPPHTSGSGCTADPLHTSNTVDRCDSATRTYGYRGPSRSDTNDTKVAGSRPHTVPCRDSRLQPNDLQPLDFRCGKIVPRTILLEMNLPGDAAIVEFTLIDIEDLGGLLQGKRDSRTELIDRQYHRQIPACRDSRRSTHDGCLRGRGRL